MGEAVMKADTRVKINTANIGTIRIHNPYRFTDYVASDGDEGIIVDSESLPEGWVLVRLDEPDPEPDHHDSDGHLYAPVHPGMIEAV